MTEKNSLKIRVNIIFFAIVTFLSFAPLWYFIGLLPYIANEIRVLVVIIFGFLFQYGFYSNKKDLLGFFLTEELLEKLNIYVVRWKNKEFDDFVGKELLELYQDNQKLFTNHGNNNNPEYYINGLSDYSPLVLPIAKVYEGILKKILVEAEIISEDELLKNPSLNVGKYFNPTGNSKILNYVKDSARDKFVPHTIYSTYQECRNQILHYD